MKRYLILSIILLVSYSSYARKERSTKCQGDSVYKVYKIDSINSYYLIYCEKDSQLYKVVSKKEKNVPKKWAKIKTSGCYNLILNIYPPIDKSNNQLAHHT